MSLVLEAATSATPVQVVGDVMVKRDDLYRAPGGSIGGKARTCHYMLREGLAWTDVAVTAGSRKSPQVSIVASIAYTIGYRHVRIHTPEGTPGPEIEHAVGLGAERICHRPGYNGVITARAREDAKAVGGVEIPFGMECREAIEQNAGQVLASVHQIAQAKRLIVAVGSGMSLAGILAGLDAAGLPTPVLAVFVGAATSPRRLDRYAPGWRERCEEVRSPHDYHDAVVASVGGIELDPIYEAKCVPFLRPGDCFWVIGARQTMFDRAR